MFIAGVSDTGDKLFPDVNDTGDETHNKISLPQWTLSKTSLYECKKQPNSISKKIWKHFISQQIFKLSPVSITPIITFTFEYLREFS